MSMALGRLSKSLMTRSVQSMNPWRDPPGGIVGMRRARGVPDLSIQELTVPEAATMPVDVSTTMAASQEIAAILVEAGALSATDLDYALRVRAKLANPRPLVSVLQDLDMVSPETLDRKSTRLNSSHPSLSRMPSSA